LSTKTPLNRSLDLFLRRRRPRSLARTAALHAAVREAAPLVPALELPPQPLLVPPAPMLTPPIELPKDLLVQRLPNGTLLVSNASGDPVLTTES
jgi:hypothetical protein